MSGLYKEIVDLCARDALEQKLQDVKVSSLQGKLALVIKELAVRVGSTRNCASGNASQGNVSSYESLLYNQLKEGQPNSPENLGEALVDVMFQEKAEENTALSERLDVFTAEQPIYARGLHTPKYGTLHT
ncbi:hypothetical protein PR048_028656 [Dryococelus australis]|uniref:Uncharacterized protein n=1 Tax=Dryococelus australis TaxID=614101 RepID=A0ABQ9GB65_9NEOP|nr:hypothetical protein PR048_028656 [Dryococelus australis]